MPVLIWSFFAPQRKFASTRLRDLNYYAVLFVSLSSAKTYQLRGSDRIWTTKRASTGRKIYKLRSIKYHKKRIEDGQKLRFWAFFLVAIVPYIVPKLHVFCLVKYCTCDIISKMAYYVEKEKKNEHWNRNIRFNTYLTKTTPSWVVCLTYCELKKIWFRYKFIWACSLTLNDSLEIDYA